MDPGPVDDRVLTLQANHRSQAIWEGAVNMSTLNPFSLF